MQSYRLSPTSLNLFLDCPRCFWLKLKKKISRPEQPSSTLPRGMDLLVKKYFDKWRQQKRPPEFKDKMACELIQDQQLLDKWRNWRSGLCFCDKSLSGAVLFGALDECFVDGDVYMPADYKTRGFSLKDNSIGYFQNQMDCYTLLLKMNSYKVNNTGYLIYYILSDVGENGSSRFKVELIPMQTDPDRAYSTFKRAVEFLDEPLPDYSGSCSFCSWVRNQP
ncbi:MAG: hypothetical protein JW734_05750 [Candidatus Omnitrophica bacterium]|nr:hypothetical protein [Candidatus Omnitrophota bacterium]